MDTAPSGSRAWALSSARCVPMRRRWLAGTQDHVSWSRGRAAARAHIDRATDQTDSKARGNRRMPKSSGAPAVRSASLPRANGAADFQVFPAAFARRRR